MTAEELAFQKAAALFATKLSLVKVQRTLDPYEREFLEAYKSFWEFKIFGSKSSDFG